MREKDEAALVKKLDRRIIPFIWVLYLLCFIDRSNVGNVHSSLKEDLSLSESQFSFGVGIFFLGYVLFEIPSNLVLKKATPSRWISRIMVSWGIVSTLMMFMRGFTGLVICRLILGIMEAGFFPGVIFYLTFWYRKEELAFRQSIFLTATTAAGAIAGLLSFGILQMEGILGLKGWQWVFLLEGLPTVVLGVATWFYLPDFPLTATFLTPEERELAVSRVGAHVDHHEFSRKEFIQTLTDLQVWLFALIYITMVSGLYGIIFFLPAIIQGLGFSQIFSNILTVPVYGLAIVTTVCIAYHSDKKRERPLHIVFSASLSILGFLLLSFLPELGQFALSYVSCFIIAAGNFAAVSLTLTWLTNTLDGSTSGATGTALVISFGNLGGLVIPMVLGYAKTKTGSYGAAFGLVTILMVAGVILTFILRRIQHNQRKKGSPLDSDAIGLNSGPFEIGQPQEEEDGLPLYELQVKV